MPAKEWWEETFNDYGYGGKMLRCGHRTLDFCGCWCDGDKHLIAGDPEHDGHMKDECTLDNCVHMECPSCSNTKNKEHEYCEACAVEEAV